MTRQAIIVNTRGMIAHGTAGRTEKVRMLLSDLRANEADFIPAGGGEPLHLYRDAQVVRLPRRLAYCWSANALRPRQYAFTPRQPWSAEGHGNF